MIARVPVAIARARVVAERKPLYYTSAAAGIAGFVQRSSHLQGPLFFCGVLGIVIALLQGPGRHRFLDLCEQSAPLFGRQLARGKALAACACLTVVAAAYCVGLQLGGAHVAAGAIVCALAGAVASTLVALNATIRSGASRALYVFLAVAVSGATYAIASQTVRYSRGAAIVWCVFVGFVALRQYGEALARWDPTEPE